MPEMIQFGTVLRCKLAPYHMWVVLSDPDENSGKMVMVNLTTLTNKCVDDVCILDAGDFPG